MLIIVLGAAAGAVQIIMGLFLLALLFIVGWAWISNCRPNGGRLLATIVAGAAVGLLVLLLLHAAGP